MQRQLIVPLRELKESKGIRKAQQGCSEDHMVLECDFVEVILEVRLEGIGTRQLKMEPGRIGKGFHGSCCREHTYLS